MPDSLLHGWPSTHRVTAGFVWVAKVLAWSVGALGLLLASLALHLRTELGRAAAEDGINRVASDRIPGRVHVDSVDAIDLGHVTSAGSGPRTSASRFG